MKDHLLASGVASLICHALLLFGFRFGTPARPVALSDDAAPVEVSLVAPPPEAPAMPEPPSPTLTVAPAPEPMPEPEQSEESHVPAMERPKLRTAPPRATSIVARQPPARTSGSMASGPTTDTRPRYRSNPKPGYPPDARRQHQEGVVLISVEVSGEGRVNGVSLRRSSGVPALDQAALIAVRRWTFEPARASGIAVASRVDVPVRFSLSGR